VANCSVWWIFSSILACSGEVSTGTAFETKTPGDRFSGWVEVEKAYVHSEHARLCSRTVGSQSESSQRRQPITVGCTRCRPRVALSQRIWSAQHERSPNTKRWIYTPHNLGLAHRRVLLLQLLPERCSQLEAASTPAPQRLNAQCPALGSRLGFVAM
jgi:hypothetical protein